MRTENSFVFSPWNFCLQGMLNTRNPHLRVMLLLIIPNEDFLAGYNVQKYGLPYYENLEFANLQTTPWSKKGFLELYRQTSYCQNNNPFQVVEAHTMSSHLAILFNRCYAGWYALRNLNIWGYYRDYFPVGLVKTAELPSNKNYIFGVYPHGIACVAAFLNFQSNANHFDKLYPGIDPHIVVLNANFRVPIAKDIFLACGGIAASEQSIINCLQSKPGASCVIMPGGASEAFESFPGKYNTCIILKNRRGFIRLAIKTGVSVVPVFSFGENEIFDQVTGTWLLWLQQKVKIILGLAPCLLKGRGFFQYSFGLLPHRRPIVTVVGKPIDIPKNPNPSTELIAEFHKKYEDGLIQLFNEYKSKYHPLGSKAVLQIE